ncbi:glycerate kinase type-2 family protein [Sphingomonas nostoxanthinifaciens]|uniref:glycerate kinase type-2 family protein n=1 Tax=Sphingomonas nostoxanthinifaciens TaxID=2872652 RepID=UPI001CC20A50|nr:glycerate kinase [Sphingomonas nostoxanthinifaciens]UAK25903.1 glycerate kinase [Sphingomonas nostoxanthinifaciens]
MSEVDVTAWDDARARSFLRELFDVAVGAADPAGVLAPHLPSSPAGRCVVVGAGKAAASMAAAVEAAWPDVPLSGTVVTPYGYGMATRRIAVREAAHPIPDENSQAAAREILAAVTGLTPDDLVLVLISGGGSSVMALPVEGVTLADKQLVNRRLLASGLDIRTMNAVRRRLSAIKGGKLALAAAPARVVTLAVSDIPGDDVSSIASGPSITDRAADIDLAAVIEKLGPGLPDNVVARLLQRGLAATADTIVPDVRLISTPYRSLEDAADAARAQGVVPVILGDDIEGESADVAAEMARMALQPVDRPTVYISGGETTVTLAGGPAGRGGRNTEFALAAINAGRGDPRLWVLAGDTDGEDGSSGGAAGAIATPDTIARAAAEGLDAGAAQRGHDSATFFAAIGDLIVTGPTRTNVNDFRAILVVPEGCAQ